LDNSPWRYSTVSEKSIFGSGWEYLNTLKLNERERRESGGGGEVAIGTTINGRGGT
jgi:hypothetical protein